MASAGGQVKTAHDLVAQPMKIPLDDRTLFGNDAGEDEDESVLMSYFVNQPAFAEFLDASMRLQVAKGRKGTGKSALLVRFAHELREQRTPRPIVLHLVPSSLAALKEPPATDNSVVLENYWKQVVCGAINMELARDIGFAWKDDQIALVESAEIAGFKGKNLLGALLSRGAAKLSLGGVVELEAQAQPRGAANHQQLLARIDREGTTGRPVWFLLDDIDTKFENSPNQQAYISSFFSACRHLVREISGIGIRATVRTDVWSSLRSAEDLDKFEQYLTDITWSAAQQKELLANRILGYIKRNVPGSEIARHWSARNEADALIELVFDRRMRWGASTAPAAQVLRVLAGGRPRWMTQLCRLAGVHAARSHVDRIGVQQLNHVMGEFGRRRLADLYKEHNHQFADMKRLVESFSGGARKYTTDQLMQRITDGYIKKTSAKNIPPIDGTAYRDSWQIAHFLFKCGFITGHNSEAATLDVHEFVSYEARPDLLQVDTNLDDGMVWEIQPAYRNILRMH